MRSHDSRLPKGARRNNISSSPTRDYRAKITYLKFLISNAEAGIVIGKGGCTISDFQSQSETRIQLSRNYEFFPGTSDRIIMVSGPIKCVLKAVELILEKFLNETYGEEGEDEPSSKFRLVVPHSCCGGIIGKGGSTIKSFVESSQADIKISSQNDHYIGLSDRLVTVVGTISEQMLAVDLILLKLSENPSYTQSINDPLSYAGMDRRVGLVYDESMCGHYSTTDPDFLERPQRIRSIWERLGSEGVTDRCTILGANEADDKYIARVHTESHINLIKKVAKDRKRDVVAAKLDSIYFNEGSAKAAYIAAGSVIRAAEAVAEGV